MITVSTDGSCLRNPGGAIGWAWVDHAGGSAAGGLASGTNQVAELMAVLEAITAHPGAEPLHIESDSQYAIKCASVWVTGWRRKGWRTASGGPVQNLTLVQGIDRAIAGRGGPVTFGWVRGHRGDRFNEQADQLAGAAAREAQAGRPAVVHRSATGEVTTGPPTVVPLAAPATAPAARAAVRVVAPVADVPRMLSSAPRAAAAPPEPLELDVLF